MKHHLHEIVVDTTSPIEFIDITDRVREVLSSSGIEEGLVNVFSNHTTACVRISEKCDRLQDDMLEFLERAVPAGAYKHDENTIDGRPNGRMHLMSLFMNASETVPVAKGELLLGKWQSIFFAELDGPRPGRKVVVRIVGT